MAAKRSLPNRPDKTNWVEEAGGLPSYIRRIAEHLYGGGMSVSAAIASAVNTVKRWAAGGTVRANGGGKVSAKTQALAQKALAEWESKRARGKLKEADLGAADLGAARRWAQQRVLIGGPLLEADLVRLNNVQRQLLLQLNEAWSGADPWQIRRELEIETQIAYLILEATDDLPLSLSEEADGVEVGDGLLVGSGAEGGQVEALQVRLGEVGHKVKVDGRFGSKTAEALRNFQRLGGIKVSGQVDEDTVAALRKAQPPDAMVAAEADSKADQPVRKAATASAAPAPTLLRRGEGSDKRSPAVREMQTGLVDRGYDVGPAGADGRYGRDTELAVKKFQREHGLKADGVVGRHTRRLMGLMGQLAEAEDARRSAATGVDWSRARAREVHALALLEARTGGRFNPFQWRDRWGRWVKMVNTEKRLQGRRRKLEMYAESDPARALVVAPFVGELDRQLLQTSHPRRVAERAARLTG